MKKRLLIAGGTGLIGSAIHEEALRQGWEVVILSRRPFPGGLMWDPSQGKIEITQSQSFDAIINLAGASIAGGRWTTTYIREVHDSRIQACKTLEGYLDSGLLTTRVYIGTSAVGIYGDQGTRIVDENAHLGEASDWMVSTGIAWEDGHSRVAMHGVRSVILRTGIVLSRKGGALKEMLKTSAFGIIGYFGNGQQFWPWIHIDDLVSIIFSAVHDEKMSGIYVAAAPEPATSKEISMAAARAFHPRRLVVPVPVFLMAIVLGKMRRMLLQSCKGYPARLLSQGFNFRYTSVQKAMKDLIEVEKAGKSQRL